MTPPEASVEILGLTLRLGRRPEGGYHARGCFRANGISAALGGSVAVAREEVEDLLRQIERQWGDFLAPVTWASACGALALSWGINPRGQLAGRIVLRDAEGDWRLEAPLRGDQSYLPRIALGLRLALRP